MRSLNKYSHGYSPWCRAHRDDSATRNEASKFVPGRISERAETSKDGVTVTYLCIVQALPRRTGLDGYVPHTYLWFRCAWGACSCQAASHRDKLGGEFLERQRIAVAVRQRATEASSVGSTAISRSRHLDKHFDEYSESSNLSRTIIDGLVGSFQ
jgi:hypothetical protein